MSVVTLHGLKCPEDGNWDDGYNDEKDAVSAFMNAVLNGSSTTNLITDDTAGRRFFNIYTDCGASSGTSVALYLRNYITGAGGSNACLRVYSDVVGVAASTAQGIQCTVGFGESTTTGSVTGLAAAGRFQVGLADVAYPGTGTIAAVQAEIYSFGDNSDPANNAIACFAAVNDGNANGMADVDDDAVLLHLRGWTVGDGNMIASKSAGTCPNVVESLRIKTPNGLRYIYVGASPLTA